MLNQESYVFRGTYGASSDRNLTKRRKYCVSLRFDKNISSDFLIHAQILMPTDQFLTLINCTVIIIILFSLRSKTLHCQESAINVLLLLFVNVKIH